MSHLLYEFEDYPSALRVEHWPGVTYIAVNNLQFSGSQVIKPDHNSAPQNAHIVAARNMVSWHFILEPDGHRGCTLFIHVGPVAEINYAATTHVWRTYCLTAGDTAGIPPNSMQGLRVPSLYCYFELLAAENNVTVNGYLKLETPS